MPLAETVQGVPGTSHDLSPETCRRAVVVFAANNAAIAGNLFDEAAFAETIAEMTDERVQKFYEATVAIIHIIARTL